MEFLAQEINKGHRSGGLYGNLYHNIDILHMPNIALFSGVRSVSPWISILERFFLARF